MTLNDDNEAVWKSLVFPRTQSFIPTMIGNRKSDECVLTREKENIDLYDLKKKFLNVCCNTV